MRGIDKNVNIYLEEIGTDTEENKKCLEKLNKILEELKNSANSAERKHYFTFKETIDTFNRYLIDKKIKLNASEKDRLAVIASSGLNNLAKKRMAEDLIHQVKVRIAHEYTLKEEAGKKKDDITRLRKSGFWLTDWYRLTKFALEFGTITTFTHRYLSRTLDFIRLKADAAHREIIFDLKEILDKYYYYLSVLEYNSIVRLYKMGESIDKLASLKRNLSYHPIEIFEEMNDFAVSYIYVMRNINYIESALKKVYKDKQPGHGFFGHVGFLTDRPVVNNKKVRYNEGDLITGTILGALYSYYTAYLGVRVKTFNQLMYIINEEGMLNGSEKEYTKEAIAAIENESHQQITEGTRIKSKLSELVNIPGKYCEMGKNLSKRLFEIEARGSLSVWNKESQLKPFFRLMKVFDAYLKYILEMLVTYESFDLEYDNIIIKGYFDNFPDLTKAVDDYRSLSIELQGVRGKDLQNFKYPSETEKDDFIKKLMEYENISTLPGEIRLLKETLNLLSARCYNLCIKFNNILNIFYQPGKIESRNIIENYNFLINAKIIHPKVRHLEMILNKKDVYLVDLFEAGCSVAEYFAETLMNKGIKAAFDEVSKLQKELQTYTTQPGNDTGSVESGESRIGEDDLNSDTEKMYKDVLTGFKRWEYFEDFILPEVYDENGIYRSDELRHVFCAELYNLVDVNRICGKDSGDLVYKRISEIINETLDSSTGSYIVLRSNGGHIIGYINGITSVESIDLLFKILYLVKEYSLKSNIESLPELIFNAGICKENKGTSALKNIEFARNIMIQGSDGQTGHLAFLRHPDQIVSIKDFDLRGRLRENLISVLS